MSSRRIANAWKWLQRTELLFEMLRKLSEQVSSRFILIAPQELYIFRLNQWRFTENFSSYRLPCELHPQKAASRWAQPQLEAGAQSAIRHRMFSQGGGHWKIRGRQRGSSALWPVHRGCKLLRWLGELAANLLDLDGDLRPDNRWQPVQITTEFIILSLHELLVLSDCPEKPAKLLEKTNSRVHTVVSEVET